VLSAPIGVPLVIDVPGGTVDGWGHDTMSGFTRFNLSWRGPVTFIGSGANEWLRVLVWHPPIAAGVTADGAGGNDVLDGDRANDTLTGGDGDDKISAGAGDDQLDGGPGTDDLDGEAGDDTCLNGETVRSCEH
jgi:Ca2+-binding RTX toxin-like protein